MLTNLGFNLLLLLMSDYVFVLGASNIGYLIFNFLNLNAGWIHRMDRPDQERRGGLRPRSSPPGTALSFVNLAFVGMGADVYGEGTLRTGLLFATLIVSDFCYRHYLQDRGRFPDSMLEELELSDGTRLKRRAGWLPYAALGGGTVVVYVTHRLAVY